MLNDIYFEYPFLGLIVLIFIISSIYFKPRVLSICFPHTAKFSNDVLYHSLLLRFLKWVIIIFIILSLMSPVKDESLSIEPKFGYELALVLDASGSMGAKGFDSTNKSLNRFDIVKSIVGDFILKRNTDNIGLVVFGNYSFIASPLTYDTNILKKIVSQLKIKMAGERTALYESLVQGVNLFRTTKSKNKILILLTDGYSSREIDKISLNTALEIAKKQSVKIYPIGIGASHEYNKNVLIKMSKETGGVAFGARDASELKDVYKQIDTLEKSKIKRNKLTYLTYYFTYTLSLAFIAFIIFIFLRISKR